MHFANLVIIKGKGDIGVEFLKAIGPHKDDGGFWDGYRIGGRWTGLFDGYDPETDERNIEVCDLCQGTGKRCDKAGPAYSCNGCEGKGRRVKSACDWVLYEGDIIPIEKLTEEQLEKFYRVVRPDGSIEFELWTPWISGGVVEAKRLLEWLKTWFPRHLCVVVDTHE